MEELKSLFGDVALTYEEFESKLNGASGIKLANLKSGNYVDRAKFEKANQNYTELESRYNQLVEDTKDYENNLKELETLRNEKANSDLISKIKDAQVDDVFAKFVLSEIKSSMKDNDKFEDVLNLYIKENPQYLKSKTGIFKNGTSTPNLGNGNAEQVKSNDQFMNDLIRNKSKGD